MEGLASEREVDSGLLAHRDKGLRDDAWNSSVPSENGIAADHCLTMQSFFLLPV